MDFEKCKDGSYIWNCFVERRKDDPSTVIFGGDNKTITAHLNGYAIIPLERYCELAGEPFNSDRMKEADYQLNKERRNDKLVG